MSHHIPDEVMPKLGLHYLPIGKGYGDGELHLVPRKRCQCKAGYLGDYFSAQYHRRGSARSTSNSLHVLPITLASS